MNGNCSPRPHTWEPVFHYSDPDLCYETNEFIIERNPISGAYRYGDDGGCSCYEGFDPSSFTVTYDFADARRAFTAWASRLANTARAQEEFHGSVRAVAA